jgi:hypothetical protein
LEGVLLTEEAAEKLYEKLKAIEERQRDPSYCIGAKEDIIFLFQLVSALTNNLDQRNTALVHIQSMAGNPDAAEGCRLIIQRAQQALEGKE